MRQLLLIGWIITVMLTIAGSSFGQDTRPNDYEDFFLVAEVSDETPKTYVGEQVEYTLRLHAYQPNSAIADAVTLPQFEGFWRGETYEAENWRVEVIEGVQYTVGEITVELTPLLAGTLSIEPATLTVEGGVFLAGEYRSNPVFVDVQSLPTPTADGFGGAVGNYSMTANLEGESARVGEPLRLTMDIQGSGNFALLPRPTLPLSLAWQVIVADADAPTLADRSIVNIQFGRQVFEWLLIPRETGTQIIDTVRFVFLNPETQSYVTLTAPQFEVSVFPNETRTTLETSVSVALRTLKSVPALSRNNGDAVQISWFIWWIMPTLAIMVGGWRVAQSLHQRQSAQERTANAARRALERLKSVSETGTPNQLARQLRAILRAYLMDKINDRRKSLTSVEVQAIIEDHMPPEVGSSLVQALLVEIENLEYAPSGVPVSLSEAVATAKKTIVALEQQWVV